MEIPEGTGSLPFRGTGRAFGTLAEFDELMAAAVASGSARRQPSRPTDSSPASRSPPPAVTVTLVSRTGRSSPPRTSVPSRPAREPSVTRARRSPSAD